MDLEQTSRGAHLALAGSPGGVARTLWHGFCHFFFDMSVVFAWSFAGCWSEGDHAGYLSTEGGSEEG